MMTCIVICGTCLGAATGPQRETRQPNLCWRGLAWSVRCGATKCISYTLGYTIEPEIPHELLPRLDSNQEPSD